MPDPLLVVDDNPPQQEAEPAQQQPQQEPNKSTAIEGKTVPGPRQGSYHSGHAKDSCCYSRHRNYLKRLKNKESQIDELHQSVRKQKHTGIPHWWRVQQSQLMLPSQVGTWTRRHHPNTLITFLIAERMPASDH
jgi:hypothetical protein